MLAAEVLPMRMRPVPVIVVLLSLFAVAGCLVVGKREARDVTPRDDTDAGPDDDGEGEAEGEGEGEEGEGEEGEEGEGEEGEGEGEFPPDGGLLPDGGPSGEGDGEGEEPVGVLPPTCMNGGLIAMFDRAVCFVDANDELRCAGMRGETVFGSSFVLAGQSGVRQILGSMTANHDHGSSLCVRRTDGVVLCLGYSYNVGDLNVNNGINWQQLRPIDGEEPGPEWTQWGTRGDVVELATGSMDQICARYADGTADCTAFICGLAGEPQSCPSFTPTRAREIRYLGGGVEHLWVDGGGMVHINETDVWRVGDARTDCIITADGLVCGWNGTVMSPPSLAGHIVDGGRTSWDGPACWLTDEGVVSCVTTGWQLFAGKVVVGLALNVYSGPIEGPGSGLQYLPSLCAIVDDGSVWCIGNNDFGRLGTGDEEHLLEETEVAPPGTAHVACVPG